MFDYLQQFNKLPKELREKVSSPAAMEILSSLESKYGISLAMVVMLVMIKQIPVRDLPSYFVAELSLAPEKAQSLARELQEKLFFLVAAYLGLKPAAPLNTEDKEIEVLMKENGVILASQDLVVRCRLILNTYRRGVRSKIDARDALVRPANEGGLSLDPAAADRLIRALDRPAGFVPVDKKPESPRPVVEQPQPEKSVNPIDELIRKNDVPAYDFKSALARGEIKPPAALADRFKAAKDDTAHEISAPKKQIAIEAPDNIPVLGVPEKEAESIKPNVPVPVTAVPMKTEQKPLAAKQPIAPASKAEPVKPTPAPVAAKSIAENKPSNLAKTSIVPPTAKKPDEMKGLWGKLFKQNAPKPTIAPAAVAGSHHLEEAVMEAVAKTQTAVRPAASSESRPKIEDVKLKPKVMGPLEELRFLDVLNFRRLGKDPQEICAKIVMKIRLLEKDGYDRMVEGVKAWRQSPVNRLYLRLAQEAVMKGVTLRDAVAARQAEKKETLTMEEIEAVVAMNSQLMF
ncbi:MAG: hypothetical protein ACM3PZ_02235 [Bacillota bacterium]